MEEILLSSVWQTTNLKKSNYMVLAKYSERFGMTMSNLLSVIGLLILLFSSYVNFRLNVARIEAKIQEIDIKFTAKYDMLEKAKDINVYNIEQGRKENREDHKMIMDKLDDFLSVYKSNK
jgi:lipocalin